MTRLDAARLTAALLTPLAVLVAFVAAEARRDAAASHPVATSSEAAQPAPLGGVTVVYIIDSLREQNGRDAALMPELAAFSASALRGPLHSCAANFTLPCLLTTFEGRESPFVTALSNFSGTTTHAPNWFESLHSQGLRVRIVGDHTLPSLYARFVTEVLDYEDTDVPVYERDRWAMDAADRILDAGQTDVLVLHIVGTDKIAHAERPGSPEYEKQFREADAYVGTLARRLDPARDTLLVFGDHGHGQEGHHDRHAWYALRGPHVTNAELPVAQTSLLYLMARTHGLTTPLTYEGSFLWPARPDDPTEPGWRRVQAEALGLAQSDRGALDHEVERAAQLRRERPWADARAFIPWALHLAFALAAAWTLVARTVAPRPYHLRGTVVVLTGLVVAASPWAAWALLPVPALLLRRLGLGAGRRFGVVLVGLVAAAAVGALIPTITAHFHMPTTDLAKVITWHVITVLVPLFVGLAAGRSLGPDAARGWRPRLAHAALVPVVTGLLLLGPGVYYYGAAQQTFHVLFAALLVSGLALTGGYAQGPQRGDVRPSALLAIGLVPGLLFARVSAGGWEWTTLLQSDLRGQPELVLLGLACLAPPALAALAPRGDRVRAFLLGVAMLLLGWPLRTYFEVPPERIVALFAISVAIGAALRLLARGADWLRWTALAAGLFVALWALSSGFYLRNLSLDFALQRLGTLFSHESDLALAAAGLVALRYVLLVVLVLLGVAAAVGARGYTPVARGALVVLLARLCCQAVQLAAVRLVEEEKSSELILQESIGVAWLALVVGGGLLAPAAVAWLGEWTLGRDRVGAVEPPA